MLFSQAHRSDQEVVTISRTEQVLAHDGGRFTGYLVLPAAGSGPGLVVSQEIFGVNGYIKGVCGRLAKLGYVAMAPDLYWRLSPGVAHRGEGFRRPAAGVRLRWTARFRQGCRRRDSCARTPSRPSGGGGR